jgi:hypothetical protein
MNRVETQTAGNLAAPRKRSGLAVGVQRIRNAARRRYDQCLRSLGQNRQFTLALVNEPAEFGGVKSLVHLPNRRTQLSAPRLFGQQLEVIPHPALEAPAPDLHFLELNDVGVVGGSMAILREGKLLHPELLHTGVMHEDKAPDLCRFADAGRKAISVNAYTRFGGRRRVQVGIHLLKEHSANYYHWLFECLPRLIFFREHLRLADAGVKFTLLIEDNLPEQCLDAMRRVITFPCEIETVRRGELVYCDRLFYVSPFWYSLDNSRHEVNAIRDYAVDKFAVAQVHEAFRSLRRATPPTRKIYVPRAVSQVRRIINAPEVETVMRENGFEIIYPHHFSFPEQIELFSSARIMVGATGAAFSNMVFMQPGTKAVIFSPKQLVKFNYYIFQQQADVAGVELMHLLAVPPPVDDYFVHNDFSVNCSDLQTLIQRLN